MLAVFHICSKVELVTLTLGEELVENKPNAPHMRKKKQMSTAVESAEEVCDTNVTMGSCGLSHFSLLKQIFCSSHSLLQPP